MKQTTSARVLVIDSRAGEAELLRDRLAGRFDVEAESDPEAALRRLAAAPFDAVLLEDGLLEVRRLLSHLERHSLGCFLVLCGERPSPQRALAAVMAGAYTYLMRPLSGPKVAAALRRGLRNRQKLLGIVSLADRLREANRKLTQQKRRLLEEKRQLALKSRQLNLINELSSAASATLEPGRIVGGVGGRLCRELPISSWAVLFAPPGGERATLFVPGPLGQGAAQELGRGLIERLARVGGKGRGFEVSSVGRRALAPAAAAALAREAGLVLPLLAGGQLIGLYKLLPEVPLSAELVRLGESAANMVALGLKNAGELMLARRLAERDGLTRIANRRAFERQLRREFSRSRRYRQPLTLLMADIDHFKRVNDRYGHQVGDRVLCQVARLFSETVRHSDFVARYGGEEFVVILPETGLESSLVLAGRLKRSVEERPLLAVPEPLSLTLSLGLADTGAPLTDEAPDLVRLADRALYVAKARGRNRISTWLDIAEMEARPARAGQTPPRGWQLWEAN